METLNYLKEYLHIDPVIVLLVIGSGFFQDYYLKFWTLTKDTKTSGALKTLIISSIVSAIYLSILSYVDKPPKEMWAQYFLSYFLATSFYELLIRPITKYIKKITNKLSGENETE